MLTITGDPYHQVEVRADGALIIGGVSAAAIAKRFGTPVYVIDGSALRRRLQDLRELLAGPSVSLYFSIKANANSAVLKCCVAAEVGLDACSPVDVQLALAAGAAPGEISYTGVGLTEDALRVLASQRVHVNLDSMIEVERFARVAPGCSAGLRVIPDIRAGFHAHCQSGEWGGKFGVERGDVPRATRALERSRCELRTLHTHLGSSIHTATPYLSALRALCELATDEPSVKCINLGGGLAPRYHPDDPVFPFAELREGIREQVDSFRRSTGRDLIVALEPGEMVVSEAGYVLSRVLVTKQWRRDEEVVDVAIIDASMNLLPSHSLYGTYLHVYVDRKSEPLTGHAVYDVYGCTNQSGDRLVHRRQLPRLSEDDILLFRNAGAYAYSRSTQFNERPRPAEVWLENGEARLVRPAEHIDTLVGEQQRAAAR